MFFVLVFPLIGRGAPLVDFSGGEKDGAVQVANYEPEQLQVNWSDKSGAQYQVVFNLHVDEPLLKRFAVAPASSVPFQTATPSQEKVAGKSLTLKFTCD